MIISGIFIKKHKEYCKKKTIAPKSYGLIIFYNEILLEKHWCYCIKCTTPSKELVCCTV